MKVKPGFVITVLAMFSMITGFYIGAQKYTEYKERKQTMAFLGLDEESK